jgi:hypothetical protein
MFESPLLNILNFVGLNIEQSTIMKWSRFCQDYVTCSVTSIGPVGSWPTLQSFSTTLPT